MGREFDETAQSHCRKASRPLGLKGVVVGQGDSYEEALSDVKSAIRFHIESFGETVLNVDPPILEAFIAEAMIEA
jgi:predicted RNase H-like HicB family nuclease